MRYTPAADKGRLRNAPPGLLSWAMGKPSGPSRKSLLSASEPAALKRISTFAPGAMEPCSPPPTRKM